MVGVLQYSRCIHEYVFNCYFSKLFYNSFISTVYCLPVHAILSSCGCIADVLVFYTDIRKEILEQKN